LLFAERQALRPVFDPIQFARERAESYLLEHCSEPRRRDTTFIAKWVEQRAGKGAERQIRPLRDKEHSPFAEPDFAAAERPNSGNRSQQGTLSRTGRALDQQRFATSWRERNVTQQWRAIRQIEIDLFDSNPDIPTPNIDLPRCTLWLMDCELCASYEPPS
jgi:hypothetical protein